MTAEEETFKLLCSVTPPHIEPVGGAKAKFGGRWVLDVSTCKAEVVCSSLKLDFICWRG
jgi:hypothetical protein